MGSKYPLVKNTYLRKYLYGYDFLSNIVINKTLPKHGKVKKLLLRNPAALGDVFYTLRLVRAIKAVNPEMFIGLIVGSWVLPLVRYSTDIDAIHIEDHWILNRGNIGVTEKIGHWLYTRFCVVSEIEHEQYDMAIDLYPYFPSAASLLWQAGIPERIGYDSHEGSIFYTNAIKWENLDIHSVEYQSNLVKKASISVADISSVNIKIDFVKCDDDLLKTYSLFGKKYLVISVGCGDIRREWSREKWQILLKQMHRSLQNYYFVFIGVGKREDERILALMQELSDRGLSLCNKLSIPELMQIIKNASLFIGLESFAGHIAAMYKVPQISIMHGAAKQVHWEPFANPNCTVIRKNMRCSPCYFPSLCQYDNACMNISAEVVWKKVNEKI